MSQVCMCWKAATHIGYMVGVGSGSVLHVSTTGKGKIRQLTISMGIYTEMPCLISLLFMAYCSPGQCGSKLT